MVVPLISMKDFDELDTGNNGAITKDAFVNWFTSRGTTEPKVPLPAAPMWTYPVAAGGPLLCVQRGAQQAAARDLQRVSRQQAAPPQSYVSIAARPTPSDSGYAAISPRFISASFPCVGSGGNPEMTSRLSSANGRSELGTGQLAKSESRDDLRPATRFAKSVYPTRSISAPRAPLSGPTEASVLTKFELAAIAPLNLERDRELSMFVPEVAAIAPLSSDQAFVEKKDAPTTACLNSFEKDFDKASGDIYDAPTASGTSLETDPEKGTALTSSGSSIHGETRKTPQVISGCSLQSEAAKDRSMPSGCSRQVGASRIGSSLQVEAATTGLSVQVDAARIGSSLQVEAARCGLPVAFGSSIQVEASTLPVTRPQRLTAGALSLQGRKATTGLPNQDTHLVVPFNSSLMLVAVFDGHGGLGHYSAARVKSMFAQHAEFLAKTNREALPQALTNLFHLAHDTLLREGLAKYSGTTATVAMVDFAASLVTVAHVGDSTLVVMNGAELRSNTMDHRVDEQAERRVAAHGGLVRTINNSPVRRICAPGSDFPGLSMARALGDQEAQRLGAQFEPEISFMPFEAGNTLVVASDGLWDMLPPNAVAAYLAASATSVHVTAADRVSKLVRDARGRYPPGGDIDDITAILVQLEVCSNQHVPTQQLTARRPSVQLRGLTRAW